MTAVELPVAATERSAAHAGFTRRFMRNRLGVVAFAFIVLAVLVCVAAPLLAPHDPLEQDLSRSLEGPSAEHLLGTDELGRDVLSRLMYGGRISLGAAALVVVVAFVLGVVPGLVAGYLGGWTDRVLSLVTDAVMSIPPLILALGVIAVMGPGLVNSMLPVGVIFAPRFLRITRSAVISARVETYVDAARTIGTSTTRIISSHILPNVLSPIFVQASLMGGFAMLAEAGLSYLGLGVQPPQASWGAMIGSASRVLNREPMLIVWPGLCVTLCVLSFSLLGDALRDSVGRQQVRSDG
jgi:ABC-type dipeptide/oligopeptide/nickel transport system permease subunit